MSSIEATLAERGSRYGEFTDHADITQTIKAAMALGQNWDSIDNDMREALEMVAHKIGRILNGDPRYIDSWTDIIGYTRLVEKRLIAEQATVKTFVDQREAGAPTDGRTIQPCDDPDCPFCGSESLNAWVVAGKLSHPIPADKEDRKFSLSDLIEQALRDEINRRKKDGKA